jgi:hypothetical protein
MPAHPARRRADPAGFLPPISGDSLRRRFVPVSSPLRPEIPVAGIRPKAAAKKASSL